MANNIPNIAERRWQQTLLLQQSVSNTVESNRTRPLEITWAKFADRLTTKPIPSDTLFSTFQEYRSKKSTGHLATELKARNGWYVKGPLDEPLYESRGQKGRMPYQVDILTLDFDLPPLLWEELLPEVFSDFAWVAHTTASHQPKKPKCRVIIPLAKPITLAESEAVTHHLFSMTCQFGTGEMAWWHGLTESIRPGQPMFFPTICLEQEFKSISHDSEDVEWLDASEMLNKNYPAQAWKDKSNWVEVPDAFKKKREQEARREASDLSGSQPKGDGDLQDVFEKGGTVGAICQTYSIERMFDEVFSSEYERGSVSTRYTYIDGSSVDGVWLVDPHPKLGGEHTACIIYHDSDPMAGDKPINVYDFIRLKLFGGLGKAEQKLKMREWCDARDDSRAVRFGMGAPPTKSAGQYDARVKRGEPEAEPVVQGESEQVKDKYHDKIKRAPAAETQVEQGDHDDSDDEPLFFDDLLDNDVHDPDNEDAGLHRHWIYDRLNYSISDNPKLINSERNRLLMQRYSREFNSFYRDAFTGQLVCTRNCTIGFIRYRVGQEVKAGPIAQALVAHAEEMWGAGKVSLTGWVKPIREWLTRDCDEQPDAMLDWMNSLEPWDGKERIKHIMTRFLQAEPSLYTQTVSTQFLISIVARQFEPGLTWENVPVFASSKQGIGKSTLAKLMVPERSWFNDTFSWKDLGNSKKVIEELGGVAIVEVGEMTQFSKDMEANKNTISRTHDTSRTAYAVDAVIRPRRFIIVGTTNDEVFLTDTENRRYWPIIGTRETRFTTQERLEMDELRDQWFAEAIHRYKNGELTYQMPDEFIAELKVAHHLAKSDVIADFESDVLNALEKCAYGSPGSPARITCGLEVYDVMNQQALAPNSEFIRYSQTPEGMRGQRTGMRDIGKVLRANGYRSTGTKIKPNYHDQLCPQYDGKRAFIRQGT